MSRKGRELSSDEKALWRRVAKDVKRLRPAPAEEDAPEPVAAKPAPRAPGAKAAAPKPVAPKLKPPPADRGAEKRVRRGQVEIEGHLDLHGLTYDQARASVLRFVSAQQRRGARTVVIVTGKGRAGEGMLKRALPGWLGEAEVRPLIAGFAQAHRAHGGAGAFYVFLKKAKDS